MVYPRTGDHDGLELTFGGLHVVAGEDAGPVPDRAAPPVRLVAVRHQHSFTGLPTNQLINPFIYPFNKFNKSRLLLIKIISISKFN